jgi:hypothetical protein
MTEVQLANRALRHAKLSTIESLDDQGDVQAYIREELQSVIDEGLESYDWTFARERTTLNQIDVEYSTWLYVYDLPDGMIVPRIFTRPDVDHRFYSLKEDDYELFYNRETADKASQRMACNQETMDLVYTRRITVVPYLPDYFARAIAYLLAFYLANTFGGQERSTWASQYWETIAQPKAADRDKMFRAPSVRGESELVDPDAVFYDPYGLSSG